MSGSVVLGWMKFLKCGYAALLLHFWRNYVKKKVRIGCSPDITNKGGPLVAAIFLRELHQTPPVESGNKSIALCNFGVAFKVSFALYFTFYEA